MKSTSTVESGDVDGDSFVETTDSSIVAVVAKSISNSIHVGLAFAKPGKSILGVCTFTDSSAFVTLQQYLYALDACEGVLLPPTKSTAQMHESMAKAFRGANIPQSIQKHPEPHSQDRILKLHRDLARLFGVAPPPSIFGSNISSSGTIKKQFDPSSLQTHALIVLWKNMGFDSFPDGSFSYSPPPAQHLSLLPSDCGALRVFPTASSREHGSSSSLYSLLDKTKTKMGQRLLREWLHQPSIDLEVINARHDLVELFLEFSSERESLRELMRSLPDIGVVARKLRARIAKLKDNVLLYQCCLKMSSILRVLKGIREQIMSKYCVEGSQEDELTQKYKRILHILNKELVEPLETSKKQMNNFEALVEKTMDLQALASHEYAIKPEFSSELKSLDVEIERCKNILEDLRKKAVSKLGLTDARVKLEENATHGKHLKVTRKDTAAVKRVGTFVVLETRTTGCRFVVPKFRSVCDRLDDLVSQYSTKQGDLVDTVMKIAFTYDGVSERMCAHLSVIDVLTSFAQVSASSSTPYVRPSMLPMKAGRVQLKGVRHALLDAQMEQGEYIPNDLNMCSNSENIHGEDRKKEEEEEEEEEEHDKGIDAENDSSLSFFHIITGPNCGGKTCYIKSIGLCVIMAQVGCFVPCDEASISIRDRVLCRAGASDSLALGMSTFMLEMSEMASILTCSDQGSLVLVDELGRGTSTTDGFALAWAISEALIKKKVMVLFATHIYELTEMSHVWKGVKNFHVASHIEYGYITRPHAHKAKEEEGCEEEEEEEEEEGEEGKEGSKKVPTSVIRLFKIREGAASASYGIQVAEIANFPTHVVSDAKRRLEVLRQSEEANMLEYAEQKGKRRLSQDKARAYASLPLKKALDIALIGSIVQESDE
ncbi:DNA mismatch repair protein MSH2 [Aduncisulcus paluster]|uniref:DNA mismatch repair protein MSH2 n=1 Tax=Aduncisulcus paluster TaxID=2918883 RepID=A0ABQ5K666_9EUKA|nr:DNA mismatch repair protein MSH2 [Aduncisulcus paluster]